MVRAMSQDHAHRDRCRGRRRRGRAPYFTNTHIIAADCNRSFALISQDDDASWCRLANGQGVKGDSGTQYCALAMPEYQAEEGAE